MKTTLTAGALLLMSTAAATAGGLDRTGNNYGALFQPGNYMEFGLTVSRPNVSGDYPVAFGGGSTGNMAENYANVSFAYKHQFTDQVAAAILFNQPYGANALYTGGVYTGLGADWESQGITALLKYSVSDRVSVYGGARMTTSEASLAIPDALNRAGFAAAAAAGDPTAAAVVAAPAGTLDYSGETSSESITQFIVGAAYEIPEIALRVALTYEQGGTYTFTSTETWAAVGLVGFESEFDIEMPSSIKLDFQTGIAEDTLLFGSIAHTTWSVWDVAPAGYAGVTGQSVTGLDNDVTSYNIGIGRRLSDDLSVLGSIGYEASSGGVASRLAPTDGSLSIGVGARYTMENSTLTAGVRYVQLGDATDGSGVEFSGNSALGFGITVGTSF